MSKIYTWMESTPLSARKTWKLDINGPGKYQKMQKKHLSRALINHFECSALSPKRQGGLAIWAFR